ncbi:MAG: hypothetical protein ABI333_03185 [bacterium]
MTSRREGVGFLLAGVTSCLLGLPAGACRPTRMHGPREAPAWARNGWCSLSRLPFPVRPVIAKLRTDEPPPPGALDRVRAQLPQGWALKVSGNAAVAERRERVQLYLPSEVTPPSPAGKARRRVLSRQTFRIILFFSRRFSPREQARQRKQQDALLERLRGIVRRLAPPGPAYCVRPHRQNKELYDRLVGLARRVERVPRYYSPLRSVHLFDSREHFHLQIHDAKVRVECDAVLGRITALFKRYPESPKR